MNSRESGFLTWMLFGSVLAAMAGLGSTGFFPLHWIVAGSVALALAFVTGARSLPSRAWTVLSILFFLVFLEEALLRRQPVTAAVKVLIYVAANRAFQLRTPSEHRQLFLCGFLLMLAACAYALSFTFVWFLGLYLFLAAAFLVSFHLAVEQATAAGGLAGFARYGAPRGIVPKIMMAALLIAIPSASALFYALPRIGIGRLNRTDQSAPHLSGFSSDVDLNDVSSIVEDRRVVMRVKPGEPPDGSAPVLYIRGVAFDTYEGNSWHRDMARRAVANPSSSEVRVNPIARTHHPIRYDYTFEPMLNAVLFMVDRSFALKVDPIYEITADKERSFFFSFAPLERVRYSTQSDPLAGTSAGEGTQRSVPDLSAYLSLPPLPEGIARFAASLAPDGMPPLEAAHSIENHLQNDFDYALDIRRDPGRDPLSDFILVRRTGHCEYFATAMAVMLRMRGIPSRLVNGFATWEFNDYDGYYIVRQSNAHSWVEAYMPGRGWMRFDPTPASRLDAPSAGILASASKMLDAARFRWDRYVLGYSLEDQITALGFVKHNTARVTAALDQLAGSLRLEVFKALQTVRRIRALSARGAAGMATMTAVLLGLLLLLIRRKDTGRETHEAALWYRRMERFLRARGECRRPSETPEEFASRVSTVYPGVKAFTEAYQRNRFGRPGASSEDLKELGLLLDLIRRRGPVASAG